MGMTKGYKQTPEHIQKRKRFGSNHHAWLGDRIVDRSGRSRAERKFRDTKPCEVCGEVKSERHHKDGNTRNNDPTNIQFLCRRHHMEADGRMDFVREHMKEVQKIGIIARWN